MRGVLGLALVLTLGACSSGADKPAADKPAVGETAGEPAPTSAGSSSTPLPAAADGQNYRACIDGDCEVLVRKSAELTLGKDKLDVTVSNASVRITDGDGYVSIGGGGVSSWGPSGGPLHTASLKAADGDTAIVVLTTQ